jgi:hypothetical protein
MSFFDFVRVWRDFFTALALPVVSAIWAFFSRLEVITMVPITTLLAMPVFVYLLLRRGFYRMLFASERNT